jgi:hypothetical protein
MSKATGKIESRDSGFRSKSAPTYISEADNNSDNETRHEPCQKRGKVISPSFVIGLGTISVVASICLFWSLGKWSWDVDEVPTLQELQLLKGTAATIKESSQYVRSPRLMPIWYWCESQVMAFLPLNETTARLFPSICGLLLVMASFIWAWHSLGRSFAICLALLILASPLFLFLAQQIRFYSLALLFQCLAHVTILGPTRRFRPGMLLLSVFLTLAAILCHNVLLIYFVLAAAVAIVAYALGWFDRTLLIRSLAAGSAAICLYLYYLKPIIQGWNESLPHRTTLQVASSLLSEAGIPMLILACLGVGFSLQKKNRSIFGYWALMGAASIAFMLAAPLVIWYFNFRYASLFLLPIWVLATQGTLSIGQILADRRLSFAWYVCVVVLLLPKFLSYYQDGSRWDLRRAAEVVSELSDEERPLVYCNLPAILEYYLPSASIQEWPNKDVLDRSCFLVLATNAWDEPVHIKGYTLELLTSVGRRRFDEQSYLVRVYQIQKKTSVAHSSRQVQGERIPKNDP